MRALIVLALVTGATLAHAQSNSKKELVAKVLQLQQASIEGLARNIVERPALQMMQAAGATLQAQVPPAKREAAAKSIDADVRKFVDEGVPILTERAIKIAPATYGAGLEEKFTEDELRQLIAWLESPVNKKFQQLGGEMQGNFVQKLAAEAAPLLDPKLQALQQKLRTTFSAAAASAPPSAAAASAAAVKPGASAAKASK